MLGDFRRLLAVIPACALALASGGCLVIPHKESRIAGVVIPEKATQPLGVGESTRADVLHALGQPDIVDGEGRVFVYRWKLSSVGWLLIIPGTYSAGVIGGEIPTAQDFLMLEFDEAGLLRRIERVRDRGFPNDPKKTIQPWIDQGARNSGEPPQSGATSPP